MTQERMEDRELTEEYAEKIRRMLPERYAGMTGRLSPREAKVLSLRFGLEDGCPRTLEEVGRLLGITRERARQIEAKFFRSGCHLVRRKKLRDYLDD